MAILGDVSMIRIIYISSARLTDKALRDSYIEYCLGKGASVEYWDIVSLVRKAHEEQGALAPSYLRRIKSYKEFESLLCLPENERAIYVILLSYTHRFRKPFRLLSKYNCRMVNFSYGAMPRPLGRGIAYRLLGEPARFARTVAGIIFGSIYRKLNLVKRYDLAFVAGQALMSINQYAAKVVQYNHYDYELYRRASVTSEHLIEGKYAVFLDANAPYHSDLEIVGLEPLNPDVYFKSLNRLFCMIEKSLDLKVVIAGNPRSRYGCEVYENREFHRLRTADLVKGAEFVILHQSTALNYAVLNLKPVLFVYTDEMMRMYKIAVVREMEALASYLNATIYNVDQITDSSQIVVKMPDRERYDSYKYSYITSRESESLSSAEIFWREIDLSGSSCGRG